MTYAAIAGVILTQSVPNWVIVVLLAVMMALTAWRSIQKGASLWTAETQHMKGQEEQLPAVQHSHTASGPAPAPSPFLAQVRLPPGSP